jgi:hypothetical protein
MSHEWLCEILIFMVQLQVVFVKFQHFDSVKFQILDG